MLTAVLNKRMRDLFGHNLTGQPMTNIIGRWCPIRLKDVF